MCCGADRIMLKACDSQLNENENSDKGACDSKNHKVVKLPRKENSNAKNRWKLLARAILSSSNKREMILMKEKPPVSNLSQDFSGFDLVQVEQLRKSNEDDKGVETFTIRIDVECNKYECTVAQVEKFWTMKDLIGFNSTGRIFWPSEAALTYYVIANMQMFADSWVLELGGGMFCLAGLMLAKFSNAFAVHLTDGNENSLNNVRKSISLNDSKSFVKNSGICLCSALQ